MSQILYYVFHIFFCYAHERVTCSNKLYIGHFKVCSMHAKMKRNKHVEIKGLLMSKHLTRKAAGLINPACCRVWLSILREVTAGAVLLSCFDNIGSIDTRWAFG